MIPYGKQSISRRDIASVVSVLKSDFLTNGPMVEKFEKEIEDIVGAPSVAVSSGTAALHCAFASIEIKPGDEIITPPLTFIATQATAAICGAVNVFSDVDNETGNLDPSLIESKITERTKAIVVVDYAGHPGELFELKAIAKKHNLYLIEDAAHSFGASYRNKQIGSVADLTTFSFFPTKNITTAEGGAISSPHPELLSKARLFSRQGIIRNRSKFIIQSEGDWHQEVQSFGLNYRLPDVLCALGISQIKRLPKFLQRRNEISSMYDEAFQSMENLRIPTIREYVKPARHLYPLRVPIKQREALFNYLRNNDIRVQVNYFPAHLQPVFKLKEQISNLQVAEDFYRSEISLPLFYDLKDSEIRRIIKLVKNYMCRSSTI